jgi:thiamine-monophosphate kinase
MAPGCPILKNGGKPKVKPGKTMKKAGQSGELELIDRIRGRASRAGSREVARGIGDDCALLRLRPGEELAVTTDLSLAERHFRLDWHPAESIGHRTLARGLSDLAAMGARPVAAFLSLGLPADLVRSVGGRKAWVDRFFDGFFALAEEHNVPLAGGDLAESPVVVADIVLAGAVKRGKALLRSGARPGDLLYVTGDLGAAASGLARLAELAHERRSNSLKIPKGLEPVVAAQLYPQPRVAQGLALVRRGLASAAIDLSDGLSTDLHHLCAESGVTAEVEAAALPIAAYATLTHALNGGEDYELLFAARPQARVPSTLAGVRVTRIGRMLRRQAGMPMVRLVGAHGAQPLAAQGWEHFA